MKTLVQNKDGTTEWVETPECYKKPIQYDADACSGCKFEMRCYNTWAQYMNQNEKGLWG